MIRQANTVFFMKSNCTVPHSRRQREGLFYTDLMMEIVVHGSCRILLTLTARHGKLMRKCIPSLFLLLQNRDSRSLHVIYAQRLRDQSTEALYACAAKACNPFISQTVHGVKKLYLPFLTGRIIYGGSGVTCFLLQIDKSCSRLLWHIFLPSSAYPVNST